MNIHLQWLLTIHLHANPQHFRSGGSAYAHVLKSDRHRSADLTLAMLKAHKYSGNTSACFSWRLHVGHCFVDCITRCMQLVQ